MFPDGGQCVSPSHLEEEWLLWSIKSLNVSQDKVGGTAKKEKKKEKSQFSSSCYHFPDLWLHLVPALMCVCMCVWRGLPFIQDPVADVTFLPVKATLRPSHTHTLSYVTLQPYRKRVFPFTSQLLFPIKNTKENVIHCSVARLKIPVHISVTQWGLRKQSSFLDYWVV